MLDLFNIFVKGGKSKLYLGMIFLKKLGKSFLNLFLFSAIIHVIILIVSVVKNGDIKYLNYFRIIGLEEFWPRISNGGISDLLSVATMVSVIIVFLTISLRRIKA